MKTAKIYHEWRGEKELRDALAEAWTWVQKTKAAYDASNQGLIQMSEETKRLYDSWQAAGEDWRQAEVRLSEAVRK